MKKTRLLILFLLPLLSGCTFAFHNISIHGQATDVVDDNQKADAQVSPTLSLPIKAI